MTTRLDTLTRELTGFDSFQAMLDTHASYRPTILPRDERHTVLADAFDRAMAARGSERRAWRGDGQLTPRIAESVRLTSLCPHHKLSRECCGNAEWLRVIHAINRASPGRIGEPLDTYDFGRGIWCEEYPEFRVLLGEAGNSYVQAKTPDAAQALQAAVKEVCAE